MDKSLSNLRNRQTGGTFLLMMLFILLGGVILITIKVFPVIYDARAVERVFDEMDKEEQFRDGATKKKLLDYMERVLQVNQIRYLKKEQVEIKKDFKRKRYVVRLNYDYPVPIIVSDEKKSHGTMDITILLSFKNETEVRMK